MSKKPIKRSPTLSPAPKGRPRSRKAIKKDSIPLQAPPPTSTSQVTEKQEAIVANAPIEIASLASEDSVKILDLSGKYRIEDSSKLYHQIDNLVKIFNDKQKRKEKRLSELTSYTNFPSFVFGLRGEAANSNKCSICQDEFEEAADFANQLSQEKDQDVVSLKCSHLLHLNCLKSLLGQKTWLRCPVCMTIYGVMDGDQPAGTMQVTINNGMHCPGYQGAGTIVINYSMHSGSRNGIAFPGTHRTGYLPNNDEGKNVLRLLKIAFDRKLVFTIGRSVTTGRDNQIIWNGIHHKTNPHGGSTNYGYPDDTYLTRVQNQLAAKGIF